MLVSSIRALPGRTPLGAWRCLPARDPPRLRGPWLRRVAGAARARAANGHPHADRTAGPRGSLQRRGSSTARSRIPAAPFPGPRSVPARPSRLAHTQTRSRPCTVRAREAAETSPAARAQKQEKAASGIWAAGGGGAGSPKSLAMALAETRGRREAAVRAARGVEGQASGGRRTRGGTSTPWKPRAGRRR